MALRAVEPDEYEAPVTGSWASQGLFEGCGEGTDQISGLGREGLVREWGNWAGCQSEEVWWSNKKRERQGQGQAFVRMGRGISKRGRGSRKRRCGRRGWAAWWWQGLEGRDTTEGWAREGTYGLLRWEQRKKGQLNRRSDSMVEGREVDVAHSTVLIFWVKLVISWGWRQSGWGWSHFPNWFTDVPKIKELENASFRIRTQVFHLPSSVVFLLQWKF